VCLVRIVQCVFPSLPPPFPYCSALYDDVVVNSRVYSELALGWTSKPRCTLAVTRIYQNRISYRVV
jgi:hypothetical protein